MLLRMLAAAPAFILSAAWMPVRVLPRPSIHRFVADSAIVMAIPPGGADLRGGMDDARNADVAALKRLFYAANNTDSPNQKEAAARLGFYEDLPIARWKSPPFLPHQQVLLNIFQPEYTHCFEELMAQPQPWLYMHVHLPGGIAALGDDEYALPEGSSPAPPSLAPLEGTLMRVVSCVRLPDARMRILVQGLSRATIVRGTQRLPYARGDVQVLPDAEALLDSARRNRRWLARLRSATGDHGAISSAGRNRRRSLLAAAVAEDACWSAYEHGPYELRDGQVPPAFCCLDPAAAESAAASEADRMEQAMDDASAIVGSEEEALVATRGGEATAADQAVELPSAAHEICEQVRSALMEAAVMAPLDEAEEEAAAEAEEEQQMLRNLEIQVWLELDLLLRGIASLDDDADAMPVPTQLLGLLPPAPQEGWPSAFVLQRVAAALERSAAAQGESAGEYDAEPFMKVDARYPSRRRAQRLSYSIWQVIANYWEGLELQPALEAQSTGDRLRMALIRLRELTAQIEEMRMM